MQATGSFCDLVAVLPLGFLLTCASARCPFLPPSILQAMQLLPDKSTDSLLGMLDHLALHLLPTASTCGSSAVQATRSTDLKISGLQAGGAATAKHVQADFTAEQVLQAASAADPRGAAAEDRQVGEASA